MPQKHNMSKSQLAYARSMFQMGDSVQYVLDNLLKPEQRTHANLKYLRSLHVAELRNQETRKIKQRDLNRQLVYSRPIIPDIDLDFPSDPQTVNPAAFSEILWDIPAIEQAMQQAGFDYEIPRAKQTPVSSTLEEPGPKKRKYT